ncbi:MAG: DUF1792 domain-containing protein [Lachnospiraceae bacterium]|nr:DUF1792 domain-containing protein [Lachnospiraceae bacterium]
MSMKQTIKAVLAQMDYGLYRMGIKKCSIKVHTIEETISELITTNKSMVRFGDGEVTMIRGRSLVLQQVNPEITEGLKRIIGYGYDDLIVAIPSIFDDLSIFREESRQFWKDHLLFSRKEYKKYCDTGKIYYNSLVSRFYYSIEDKSKCDGWVNEIKKIWQEKDIVIVEGGRTHNGVGNDLFDSARSIERIIGPSKDAYVMLDEIMEACRQYPKDRLFLVSLGVAAKFLTERLFLEGYRVLDIGNLDMEYEWYLRKATGKEKLEKHDVVGRTKNLEAGYQDYLNQIKIEIESADKGK